MMIPTYSCNSDIYDHYRAPSKFIRFEGYMYRFKGVEQKGDVAIHHYRCDFERHNVKIHLQNGIPFFVEGIYKIAS